MRLVLVALLLLVGCEEFHQRPGPQFGSDQCLRREIFEACLSKIPQGPVNTVANDWAEVVSECESAAYHQSLRAQANVKPECFR